MYNLASCLSAANRCDLTDWVDDYLSGGPWSNEGLREGLQLHHRYWLGPVLIPLAQLKRCCGPEQSMEYQVPREVWEAKTSHIAQSLSDPEDVPPLIVEWQSGVFHVRDGNHRVAAMAMAGWTHCWIVLWCNNPTDYEAARATLGVECVLPDTKILSKHLRRDGWARLSGAVNASLISAASDAIKSDMNSNYDPARKSEYKYRSYCPDLLGNPAISNLLTKSCALTYLSNWFGENNFKYDDGQIAIRPEHETSSEFPPTWHIDGVGSGKNGIPKDNPISNFTALIGIYLTPIQETFAGNFTVWPGSHHKLESYFCDRGPQAVAEGQPSLDVGEPLQLLAMPGDMFICHYQLAHAAAVNLTDNDRVAVYFRVWLDDIESRRWEYLTNIWTGWRL